MLCVEAFSKKVRLGLDWVIMIGFIFELWGRSHQERLKWILKARSKKEVEGRLCVSLYLVLSWSDYVFTDSKIYFDYNSKWDFKSINCNVWSLAKLILISLMSTNHKSVNLSIVPNGFRNGRSYLKLVIDPPGDSFHLRVNHDWHQSFGIDKTSSLFGLVWAWVGDAATMETIADGLSVIVGVDVFSSFLWKDAYE